VEYNAIEWSLDIIFEVACDSCPEEFQGVKHQYDRGFGDWVSREAAKARCYGWTEKGESEVICPLCSAGPHSLIILPTLEPKHKKPHWQRILGK